MNISIRVSFPENGGYDWIEALKGYEAVGSVEVAFYMPQSFLHIVNIEDVVAPFKNLEMKCSSVHMAHARITEPFIFESVLRKTIEIARALDCNIIVAHPSFGKLEQAESFIDGTVSPLLEENAIFLCWETFSGKRRFLSGMEGIAAFCMKRNRHKVCFDFSHIHEKQEKLLEDIDKHFDLIYVFHMSNRVVERKLQHLPIFHEDADLDFHRILQFLKRRGFSGGIVLEYLPEYHGFLKKDARILIEKYKE